MSFSFLLQEAAAAGNSNWSSILSFGLILFVFYFFMIRPQQQKQKKAEAFKKQLTTGQEVVTIGGIHGKILEMNEKTVLIQSENSKLRLEKNAISMDFTAATQPTPVADKA